MKHNTAHTHLYQHSNKSFFYVKRVIIAIIYYIIKDRKKKTELSDYNISIFFKPVILKLQVTENFSQKIEISINQYY